MASNSIIQCSSFSPSSSNIIKTYDVFVSFRGDTRNNFTDHLFGALRRKGIHFFSDADDRKLKKGKHILPELLQAIDGSQILVVVFSRNYASSKWCLRELEKIAGCIKVLEKHVLPIFYDVTPSEVRNQSGDYKEVFDEYEKRLKEDKEKMEEVQRWREALLQVSNLSGWDIGNKPQYGEIEKIVQNIQKILQQSIVNSPNDDLVEIESRVEQLEKLLFLDSIDVVLSLGICGMAGIGKTTLVAALYKKIHHYFEFHYFVEDVSKIFQNSNIFGLRKQLLCQTPEENNLEIYNIFPRTNLVSHGRRLIVLDNVDHIDQLEKLALNHTCLGAGSRIIIISKDRCILEDYDVNHIYHVQPLNMDNAIQLFHKYAFKGNRVKSEYEKLKYDISSYVEGHPLLIKVLARHLANQNLLHWSNALVKLRESPKKDILDILRISFDGLEENEKEIFLDIACFHDWYQFNNVMEILHFRGFEPESGLKVLLKKSLITYYDKTQVHMQSLLIDLGKYIVKKESSKESRRRSRLWDYQDLLKVTLDNKATKKLEAIVVEHCPIMFFEATMKVDALSKMSQLKLLILNQVKFSGSLNDLSNKLAYLTWNEYPFKCLPPNFQPNNLVELIMYRSNVKRLWKGTKPLPNLKRLDLCYSKNLVKMPNFEEAPNLEWLNFEGCIQLRKIHQSIGCLRELTCLNLKDCKNLISLPTSLLDLSSLEYLNLSGCSNLYNSQLLEEPRVGKHFKKPWIGEAPIHSQPTPSIKEKSFMCSASSLLSSPSFTCMRDLDLSFCNLRQVPDAIGNLCCLEKLNLKGNKFARMPSLKKLWKLVYINLEHCKKLKYLFELPSQTDFTSGTYFPPLKIESSPLSYWTNKGLYIFNCPKLVESEEWSKISISWMIQMVKVYYHQLKSLNYPFHLPFGGTEIVIPGSEIPRWFHNKREAMDNSISVDVITPLMEDDDNWIGIAICVIFCVSHHQNNSLSVMWLPKTTLRRFPHIIPLLLDVDLVTDKSDHMYLFYFTRSYFIRSRKIWGLLDSDHIEVEFKTAYPDWNFEVKKYGYRWVYEQDLQLSNRKRKFFEIKEKQ